MTRSDDLLDLHGQIREQFFGETHEGDANAQAIDSTVKKLLAES